MSLWKQKADQRAAEEDARIAAENAAWKAKLAAEAAAKAAAEAAKTPEQKAADAAAAAWDRHCHAMCDSTEEWARHPRFYEAEGRRWQRLYKTWDEEKRIREGGHPKVSLATDFPALGKGAGAGGKK